MRSDLLSILHDDPIGGHIGSRKMFAIAALRFYWPQMRSHIRAFVSTCDLCQRNKPYNANTRGIPTPLPIPKRRFDVVALDIVSGFPKDKHGNDAAVVFTDRLTKRAWVEACSKEVTPQAVGHPPSQDRTAPILIDPDGREWFIVAEILSHRQINRPGPNQKVRVRFEGFDSTYDEWLPRKDVTDAALIEYEKFLEKNASECSCKSP